MLSGITNFTEFTSWEEPSSTFDMGLGLMTLIGTVSMYGLSCLLRNFQKAERPSASEALCHLVQSRDLLSYLDLKSLSALSLSNSVLRELSLENLNAKKVKKAQESHDTLIVWKALAVHIRKAHTCPGINPGISNKELIEKASKFSVWFEQHKQALDQVKFLFLNNNTNLKTLPPEIGQLQNLEDLDLDHNNLSDLPTEIGQLQKLKFLHLRNNNISKLPPEIGHLQNLVIFILENNNLYELPSEIGQLINLEHLILQNNNLSELPPEIGQLQKLKFLYLESNNLNENAFLLIKKLQDQGVYVGSLQN